MSALTLAKRYKQEPNNQRVCILERGQWWVSHEMPASKDGTIDGGTTIREFLHQNDMPYSTWAYPDDIKGLMNVFGNSRVINKIKGVYDYRQLKNVHVIAPSGVGGGSLVYTNVTEEPEEFVYSNWPTQSDGNPGLENYFDRAFRFIGVNPIPTTTSIGRFKLPRAKVFQTAATKINDINHNISNVDNLDAKLSITEIPEAGHVFSNNGPLQYYAQVDSNKKVQDMTADEKLKTFDTKYKKETNVCQRQGRCLLGCIPGARHTLNKEIHKAIDKDKLPLDIHPLCEVIDIKQINDPQDPQYKYEIKFLDYRDIIDNIEYDPTKKLTEVEKSKITKTIKTKQVIVAAGSLGSTEILLRCKKNGSLKLSEKLGMGFSTNGDTFGIISPTKENVDASRGPMQTSIARFMDNNNFSHSIEDLGIPKMFAKLFSSIAENLPQLDSSGAPGNLFNKIREQLFSFINLNDAELVNRLSKFVEGRDPSILIEPLDTLQKILELLRKGNQSPEERVSNILVLFGIGIDRPDRHGRLNLDNANDTITLEQEYDLTQEIFTKIISSMREFAKQIGKEGENNLIIPLWDKNNTKNRTQIVAHPLGGCRMAKDSSDGVVDSLGGVFKVDNANVTTTNTYAKLYVIDGAIIPSSLGVNPSLTITALALRIAENKLADGNEDYLPL